MTLSTLLTDQLCPDRNLKKNGMTLKKTKQDTGELTAICWRPIYPRGYPYSGGEHYETKVERNIGSSGIYCRRDCSNGGSGKSRESDPRTKTGGDRASS